MKKIKLIIVACLFAGSLCAQTEIIAHRGFWNCEGSAQNSISSLTNAQREKLYGSEVDVHATLDGVVVANHDNDIDDLIIGEKTFEQLQNIRLKNGEKLPTLKQHLDVLSKNPSTKLIIEVKTKDTPEEEARIVDLVLCLVAESKMEKHVEYISFSQYICRQLKRKNPAVTVAYLSGSAETALTPQELKAEGFDGLDYHYKLIADHPDWIKEAKDLGLTTNVWTVNDEATMKEILQLKADYITT
ncbi:MAG: glycerophosphodiester phosphodiesterase, partial [Tannerellaceae bacterium]|nr:glycerophosphodiester phosphodiesterase [Tannerellaceae bacterium]